MKLSIFVRFFLICSVFTALGFLINNTEKASEGQIFSDSSTHNTQDKIYGVTLESVHTKFEKTLYSLINFSKKTTARVVFDNDETPAQYLDAIRRIHKVSYLMGELEDSYVMNDLSVPQYKKRAKQFIDVMGDEIDIWEIGNEVNGEWNGDIGDVTDKLKYSFKYAKSKNKKTAITLFYNKECWQNQENEMFTWVDNSLPKEMIPGVDYVFVSYYDDHCNTTPDWQNVFDRLHQIFPNSKLGIGECGTRDKDKKEQYMKDYYNMKITTPNYVGGYFWWYFKNDCVPQSNHLWKVMNDVMGK